jgi:C1A family cysteine protease
MSDADIIALLQVQPLNIYLTASTWYLYKPTASNDIFRCRLSDSTRYQKMNHATLLVGVGTDYWLVRNSWGTSFGLDGYIKISRDP